MSYDIYFVRRDPGQSFEEALETTEEGYDSGDPGPLTEVELEQWERILPHARAILGEIEEFVSDSTRELSDPATGVQLSILPGEISITVPYWRTDQDDVAVMEKVYAVARAVEAETGLEGYDPQLGEPVRDAPAMAARSRTSAVPHDVDSGELSERQSAASAPTSGDEPARDESSPQPQSRRRWWEFWKW